MSQNPKFSAELHMLCGKLRERDITDAQAQRLSEMLMASRGARQFYRTFMALASALETRTAIQTSVDQKADSEKNIEVLFELLQMEQEAEVVELPLEPVATAPQARRQSKERLGWHEVADASGYLLTQAVKSGPAKWLAAAAVILLAATLFIVLSGNGDPPNAQPPLAINPSEPSTPSSTVATLTSQHNALWAEGLLAPGSQLHPGDRLTLTAGFAEITTKNGAVAILEAPATIQLLDNNNAIRLHTGKLVGICETDSSKGFVVSTPHMDITDLGTRFGVEVGASGQAEVHVLTGEVRVSSNRSDAGLRTLLAGQAVAASRVDGLTEIAYDEHSFVPDMANAVIKPDFDGTNAVWLGQVAGDLSQDKRRADALQVFLEQRDLLLERNISVDFNREHPWDAAAADKRYDVAAGERVDVYLLHFDLLNGHQQPENFVLDFDRPIVGVIISQYALNATDDTLGVAGVTYPFFETMPEVLMGGQRGLNYRANVPDVDEATVALTNDTARISRDGTRLNLRLWGGEDPAKAKMDQVRVLVRSARDQADSHNTVPVGLPTN